MPGNRSLYVTEEEEKWADNHPEYDSFSGAVRMAIRAQKRREESD